MDAANLNQLWARLWVEECIRQGIRHFCLSPGSRCTPLTLAVAEHPRAESHVFTDERSAAYFALGIGRSTGVPALFLCTSGTAVANAYPALLEAEADGVPMLLCSADRPPELWDTGANQTLRQSHLFGAHVKWHMTLPCPDPAIPLSFVLSTAGHAIAQARQSPPGPVHIDLPFREPLAPTPEPFDSALQEPLTRWLQSGQAWTRQSLPVPTAAPDDRLVQQLCQARRGVLVLGRLLDPEAQAAVMELMDALQWPCLVDATWSAVEQGRRYPCIRGFDLLLKDPGWRERLEPDLLLHIGALPISKHYLGYLHRWSEIPQLLLHSHSQRIDPCHGLHHRLQSDIPAFCRELVQALEAQSYGAAAIPPVWCEAQRRCSHAIEQALAEEGPLLEAQVLHLLTRHLPEGGLLFVGNSSPIRHLDLCAVAGTSPGSWHCNRGGSGIEGLLSTAMGCVAGSQKPGICVLGDLSMLHDLNALLALRESRLPLTVVVLNNGGGGIFRRLPVADLERAGGREEFERYFHTSHGIALAPIAEAMGLQVHQPETPGQLVEALKRAGQRAAPAFIEVRTDSHRELQWLRDLSANVARRSP